MGTRIAVLGAGSWGTALAIHLASTETAAHDVTLWARRPEAAEAMQRRRENTTYLPDVPIPEAIEITSDLEAAAAGKELWVMAAPSQALRPLAERARPYAHPDLVVVSVAKGIENDTLMTTTQVLRDVLAPAVPPERVGVLYGPSHAEEIAQERPVAVVAAAPSPRVAEIIQAVFMTRRFRVYLSDDVLGVEIGGSVKNVMAIAAGMGDGIGYGDNAKAAIISRGMAEIQRLGLAMGAKASTFAGLTGIGDLVATCTSPHSRNRRLGEEIGRGRTLADVEADTQMVAEGVRTTASVRDLARQHGIEMPISEAVHAILFEGKQPRDAVDELMTRPARREDWLPEALDRAGSSS